MGIASKLAAVQAAAGPMMASQMGGGGGYGQQQYGQQQYGQQQPGGQQYGKPPMPMPGQPSHGQPSSIPYGGQQPSQYPGQQPGQQPGYGAPNPYGAAGVPASTSSSTSASTGAGPHSAGHTHGPSCGNGCDKTHVLLYTCTPQPGQSQQQPYQQTPQQTPYGQPSYGQPPQSHGAPGGYGQPTHSQYPAAGAPYGALQGGMGGGNEQQIIAELLRHCVQDQKLQSFYPPGSVEQIAARVAQAGVLNRLAGEWRLPKEVAYDCVKLALFDVVLYLDDSGSMRFEEGGSRIDDLKLVTGRVAFATSLFDQDGISVRFMNSNERGDHITNEQQAAQLIQRVQFSGLTPLGTSLDQKILQPMIVQPAAQRQLRKPVLIITVTDGAPAGEQRWHIVNVIQNAVNQLRNGPYGPDAISFQFAQVGNDMGARDFLQELDANAQIGSLIDCTSNYELEADQARQTSGIDLSPELWLVKLLLGPIDSSYDSKDEKRHH